MRYLTPFSSSLWSRRGQNDLFDQLERMMETAWQFGNVDNFSFQPACDVEELDEHFMLSFDVPGVKKQDLKLEIDGNRLTVSGERHREHDAGDSSARHHERSYGRFERVFTLPQSVDPNSVDAHYDNGVLKVVLPKTESAKAHAIEIKEGESQGLFKKILGTKEKSQSAKTIETH